MTDKTIRELEFIKDCGIKDVRFKNLIALTIEDIKQQESEDDDDR